MRYRYRDLAVSIARIGGIDYELAEPGLVGLLGVQQLLVLPQTHAVSLSPRCGRIGGIGTVCEVAVSIPNPNPNPGCECAVSLSRPRGIVIASRRYRLRAGRTRARRPSWCSAAARPAHKHMRYRYRSGAGELAVSAVSVPWECGIAIDSARLRLHIYMTYSISPSG